MNSSFGQRLKEVRENRGLKQSDLAYLCSIKSPTVITNWERGTNKPDIDKLANLCAALSVSPNYLLGFDETPHGISFEAMEAAAQLDQLDELSREELLRAIDMRLNSANTIDYSQQDESLVPGNIYLSKDDPDYSELKEKCKQFKSLKRERYRGYEDITKFLWDCSYTSEQICIAYVIQIFNGRRVPCRELYERILAYLTKDISFTHKDGRKL